MMAGTELPPPYETSQGDLVSSAASINQGFESDEGITKPPTAPPYEPPLQERPPEINLGTLSEDDIRDACLDYVAEHYCYGKRFVRDWNLINIFNGCSFHYQLETYGEKRQTVDQATPYYGQSIDGPENGPPPAPWSMTVQSPPLFRDSQQKVEVPHTAYVKECVRCVGNCRIRCTSCTGMGGSTCISCWGSGRSNDRRCTSCSGSGRQRCWTCSGTGQVTCPTCSGKGKLKHYKLLVVTWKNHVEDFISATSNLPKNLITEVSGREILKEQYPLVHPINLVTVEDSINEASKSLINKHKIIFPNDFIRMQRHTLRAVPLTKAHYQWKSKVGEFYVYGFQKKVYFQNYPQQCCCCTCL